MTVKQLLINEIPTKNGRRYPREVIAKMAEQIKEKESQGLNLGTLGVIEHTTVPLDKVAFSYKNPVIEEGSLYVDISILGTPCGNELKTVLDSVVFRPAGMSTKYPHPAHETAIHLLGVNVIVGDDYELITINAIPKSEDAINI